MFTKIEEQNSQWKVKRYMMERFIEALSDICCLKFLRKYVLIFKLKFCVCQPYSGMLRAYSLFCAKGDVMREQRY